MSTHKNIDRICCVFLVVALLITALAFSAESLGIQKAQTKLGYEDTLFDTSKVHTINIVMDDWDSFIDSCTSEEYTTCSVVIDNEAYKNVAIRAKGNTSLSQVASYGNDRYSFKIEFDHYDSTKTYHGLDKLCLNNIIQDNTYMKDFLTYQMMAKMGVASPLCSYVYITVNGEDWGLYLAVEAVEESFLTRNYGTDYGDLYKPDSSIMGGGRGNGMEFDMEDFDFDAVFDSKAENAAENSSVDASSDNEDSTQSTDSMQSTEGTTSQDDSVPDESNAGGSPTDAGDIGSGINDSDGEPPAPGGEDGNRSGEMPAAPGGGGMGGPLEDGGPGGGGMGSDDVLLKYIDDDADSYSNIFDNAKTNITDSDKTRLINALKKLSDGEDLEDTLDIDAVIRYFVVHNFVLNFDSYTGFMIHNYYLYEEDGQLQMIPWDYNLAFGGFKSSDDATSLINYPIDSPVSGGDTADRPMIAWIFNNEEYTELYHQYFSEFLSEYFDSGYFEDLIDSTKELIAPYVEKDPTKFCTYEEFETGVATLKEFCLLRAESIQGQLDGTIGSTSDTQEENTLIDAGDLEISDMGTMNNGGDMGGVDFGGGGGEPPAPGGENENDGGEMPAAPGGWNPPSRPGENNGSQIS